MSGFKKNPLSVKVFYYFYLLKKIDLNSTTRKFQQSIKLQRKHLRTLRLIDRFQSRDHFTIGRHIGADVNGELVSRGL